LPATFYLIISAPGSPAEQECRRTATVFQDSWIAWIAKQGDWQVCHKNPRMTLKENEVCAEEDG
jgi:hypothetical protein